MKKETTWVENIGHIVIIILLGIFALVTIAIILSYLSNRFTQDIQFNSGYAFGYLLGVGGILALLIWGIRACLKKLPIEELKNKYNTWAETRD